MEEAQTRIQERKNSLANTEEILEDRYRALEEKRAELDENYAGNTRGRERPKRKSC